MIWFFWIGVLVLAISAIMFFVKRVKIAVLLLMIGGLFLRINASADPYLHEWDERYHALVAKHLIDDPFKPMLYDQPLMGYNKEDWSKNHIWLHKQPVPLWSIATSLYFFGISEFAVRIPSLILTVIGIGLMFLIGYEVYGRTVGYISAFFYAVNGLIIELAAGRSATDHVDIFFLFFIQLAVYLCILFSQNKKQIYNVLCGVSIGLAILSKWLPALIVLPIWILFMVKNSKPLDLRVLLKNFGVLLVTIIIIAVPWQIYTFLRFPEEAMIESAYNVKHLWEVLEDQYRPFYYHFERIRISFGELIYLPLIWYFVKSIKRPFRFERLAISIWIIVPILFFSFAATKMKAYTMFTAPALFMITALFFKYLSIYRTKIKYKVISTLVMVAMIALPVRYMFERVKPFKDHGEKAKIVTYLKELKPKVADKKVVLFRVDSSIEAMFYTDVVAYPWRPSSDAKLAEIHDKGYLICIKGSNGLSDEVLALENIIVFEDYPDLIERVSLKIRTSI
ncbi:MAG: glycosyltransferase family 39 protein [Salibacteraceae bacterium]